MYVINNAHTHLSLRVPWTHPSPGYSQRKLSVTSVESFFSFSYKNTQAFCTTILGTRRIFCIEPWIKGNIEFVFIYFPAFNFQLLQNVATNQIPCEHTGIQGLIIFGYLLLQCKAGAWDMSTTSCQCVLNILHVECLVPEIIVAHLTILTD